MDYLPKIILQPTSWERGGASDSKTPDPYYSHQIIYFKQIQITNKNVVYKDYCLLAKEPMLSPDGWAEKRPNIELVFAKN